MSQIAFESDFTVTFKKFFPSAFLRHDNDNAHLFIFVKQQRNWHAYVRTEHPQMHVGRWIVTAARHQNYTRGRHFARSPLAVASAAGRTPATVHPTRNDFAKSSLVLREVPASNRKTIVVPFLTAKRYRTRCEVAPPGGSNAPSGKSMKQHMRSNIYICY